MSEDNPPPTQAQDSAFGNPGTASPEQPIVQETESGQKLLQFLQRRLNLPPTLLHRWVRTGQVRINGGRCKPFARVQSGDIVRLPPFALKMAAESSIPEAAQQPEASAGASLFSATETGLPPMIGTDGYLWVFNKPAGLPTHPGTGHDDSLITRLTACFSAAPFKPTPVHRLDKDTSGVLLVAASYEALIKAQDALRAGTLAKDYAVWVHGEWPYAETRLLRHKLRKEAAGGYEKMRLTSDDAQDSKLALCLVRPLRVRQHESLLLVRLLTGRTHQIRTQLSALGHPVLGDAKYGQSAQLRSLKTRPASSTPPPARPLAPQKRECPVDQGLFLHALRVTLPCGRTFACLPDWKGEHALENLPEPLDVAPDRLPDVNGYGAFPLNEEDGRSASFR